MSDENDPGTRSPKMPYATPRLASYGNVRELTRTEANDKNKNDSLQGQNNLKT
jgi:hypothetical protein